MAKEYGMWTSATARDDLRELAEREGFGGFSDEEKYKLISVLTQLSMESPSDYQAVVDLVAKGWGPRAMPELVQEAEKRIKKYEDLRVMDYPERKAELTRLKLEDSRTYDAIREMANLSKNPSDKVIFSETTFKESEKAAKAQEAFEKKTPRQLAQEGKMKIGNVWTDKNGTRKWSYYPLTEADKTKTEAYWIEQNRKKCPELFAKSAKQNENVSNDVSFANTAATGHSRSSGSVSNSGGNMTLSANMDYALKMGPTVLKEAMEEMGISFPRNIIRHAKNSKEYIPTSKLKAWMDGHEFTDEQINKLNELVKDRDAFNAKVRDVNNRDGYSAVSTQQTAAPREDSGTQLANTSATNIRDNAEVNKGNAEKQEDKRSFEERQRDLAEQLKGMGVNTGNEFNLGQMLGKCSIM